jgi:hypothetical protein
MAATAEPTRCRSSHGVFPAHDSGSSGSLETTTTTTAVAYELELTPGTDLADVRLPTVQAQSLLDPLLPFFFAECQAHPHDNSPDDSTPITTTGLMLPSSFGTVVQLRAHFSPQPLDGVPCATLRDPTNICFVLTGALDVVTLTTATKIDGNNNNNNNNNNDPSVDKGAAMQAAVQRAWRTVLAVPQPQHHAHTADSHDGPVVVAISYVNPATLPATLFPTTGRYRSHLHEPALPVLLLLLAMVTTGMLLLLQMRRRSRQPSQSPRGQRPQRLLLTAYAPEAEDDLV